MAKLRVLVVDDSALMRKHLRELLTETGDFEVAMARDGVDALAQLATFDPHVITLDINMPEMDGLTCLSRIMAENPKPVVMVSSLTEKGAEVTYEALALGAVDYIAKPDGTISLSLRKSGDQIIAKVRAAAGARLNRTRGLADRLRATARRAPVVPSTPAVVDRRRAPAAALGLVLIGVSTGGPGALEEILPRLPAEFPWPILIAQHMPASFTATFARRLNTVCALEVEEVSGRNPLHAGHCYIGRGDADVVILQRGGEIIASAVPSDTTRLWHPSVARMVESAQTCLQPDALVAVMLTGMGDDGAHAMTELHRAGGRTIAEDASTAIVFGMPGELVRMGGASVVLPVHRIAQQLLAWLAPSATLRR